MVLQHSDVNCPDISSRFHCSHLIKIPAIVSSASDYLLQTHNQDGNSTVQIILVVKGKHSDGLLLNNVSLSNHTRDMINVTLYAIYGEFHLYKLQLLASSGRITHHDSGVQFLITTSGSASVHVVDYGDFKHYMSATTGNLSNIGYTDNMQNAEREVTESNSFESNEMLPTHMSETHNQDKYISDKNDNLLDNSLVNDIFHFNDKVAQPRPNAIFPGIKPSGEPFIVKEDKTRDEINFHETESHNMWNDSSGTKAKLDKTVIGVIV